MISTVDLYNEIHKVEELLKKDKVSEIEFMKAILKLSTLELKLLHNLRTNTVKVMEHFDIEKVKPRKTEDVEEKSQEKGK